jgi:hypothetical protein
MLKRLIERCGPYLLEVVIPPLPPVFPPQPFGFATLPMWCRYRGPERADEELKKCFYSNYGVLKLLSCSQVLRSPPARSIMSGTTADLPFWLADGALGLGFW